MIPRIFIFEGLDGCGKTTQCQNLKNYLNDKGIKFYDYIEVLDMNDDCYIYNVFYYRKSRY